MWRFARSGLFSLAIFLAACTAAAPSPSPPRPSYPEKPATMIVPFPAGGTVDLVARALVEAVKPYFPQPIAVVNRPGGAGTVGTAELVQARPDGYTIGLVPVGPVAVQPHLSQLPYRGPDDIRPIVKVVRLPVVLAVRADAPWPTVKELLDFAWANPGRIRVGHGGVGTIPHIDLELLKQQAGVELTHVPFSGAPESNAALLGGHIEAVVPHPDQVVEHVRAGRMRVLAVFEERRNRLFPEAPTFRELGYDITLAPYYFVAGPKNLADEAVGFLHDAFKRAMETDSFRKFVDDNSLVLEYAGPEELKKQLARDYELYGQIVKKVGLKG
jgi:tripartite-type tricarboxylate transporter receptor subunit TctC